MKLLKRLALTLAAAATAMALVNAAPAFADTACSVGYYENCPTGSAIAKGTIVKAELKEGKAEFKGALTVSCESAAMYAELRSNGGPVVEAAVYSMWFLNCSNCKSGELRKGKELPLTINWLGAIFWPSEQYDEVEIKNPVFDFLNCTFLNLKCTGSAKFLTGEMESTVTQTRISFIEQPVSVEGSLCGTSAYFSASYKVVLPKPPLWISRY
jgi:hypothetical protein